MYSDRSQAGHQLAGPLRHLRASHPLVLGLPRGGVPVAHAISEDLHGDLDIILVRKLGVPWQPELAMGAIGEDGVRVLNADVVRQTRVSATELARTEAAERSELERRARVLRGGRPPVPMRNRTIVIADDGMATGATVAAACAVARARASGWIVVAVPVSSPEAMRRIAAIADEVVCPSTPADLGGVGAAYHDFHQLRDEEVTALLN